MRMLTICSSPRDSLGHLPDRQREAAVVNQHIDAAVVQECIYASLIGGRTVVVVDYCNIWFAHAAGMWT